ncbi:MAG TPA: tRNA (adenosine(37)-N6)-threonylcarbamoyltransferase complex dimerization subunit type 1 TsaB [Chloroflexota bacterium]|nr:tRNA (adenosine(37)-N6)-threonylcarbamoyltransferase complex dimerization subunit type 1 TsaB [Chloroflexota bacterium]
MILAIDTSTDEAGIAIVSAGEVLAEMNWRSRGNHSRQIRGAVEQLLTLVNTRLDEISKLAVAVGPGSFSGIRVGMSFVEGLALGLGAPLVGISTLDVLGFQASALGSYVWSVLPAGRDQVYTSRYTGGDGNWRRVADYAVMDVPDIAAKYASGELLIGGAAETVAAAVRARGLGAQVVPAGWQVRRAAFLGLLAMRETESGGPIRPLYLRRSAAEEKRIGEKGA